MRIVKRVLLGFLVLTLVAAALFVLLVGPWPVYSDSRFLESDYYQEALAAIDAAAARSVISDHPGELRAGWGVRIMTPDVGVPMGGYGGRPDGKRSLGVRDELMAKAIALSDGIDTVVIIGADMLIIPPNIADMVREQVARQTPLTPHQLYFTANHTHCGPGGFAPGLASRISAGAYDPDVPAFLARALSEAIVEAYNDMKPAQLAHGAVDAPEYIRNRTRDGERDTTLNFMVVEQQGGRTCYVVRYSAHPTIFGQGFREFSAEYPGELMRHIEQRTHATAIFVGGAVGSMGPRPPEAPSPSERVAAMGAALGDLVIRNTADPAFLSRVEIASMGITAEMPPLQVRPVSPRWRLSPLLGRIIGLETRGFFQGARIGNMLFIGLPFDVSGELAREWRARAAEEGWDLWVTGFSPGYLGYLTPDRYYYELDEHGRLDYETGLMSWFGPNAEAYCGALVNRIIERLGPPPRMDALAALPAAS